MLVARQVGSYTKMCLLVNEDEHYLQKCQKDQRQEGEK